MKNLRLRSLILLLAFTILFSLTSKAEDRQPLFYIGGYADYNINMHSADFIELPGYPSCCTGYSSGSGSGFSLGALFEYPLAPKLMLGARVGYSTLNAKLSKPSKIGNVEVRKTTPPYETETITDAVSENSIDSKIGLINFEPYIGYNLYKGLNGYFGLSLGLGQSGTFDQSERLTSPVGVVFKENGTTIRNVVTGDKIPEMKGLRLGAVLGLGYQLPISATAFIVPEIRYDMGLTNISSVTWKASALQLGAHAKFPIFPAKIIPLIKETEVNRDTTVITDIGIKNPELKLLSRNEKLEVTETESSKIEKTIVTEKYELKLPKVVKFDADLQIVGIASDGTRQDNPTIIIEETETEEVFPLLPYVFYKVGESDLKASSVKNITANEAKDFKENGLPWETMDIYADMLNIVGFRMNQFPKSNLTITGSNNNTGIEAGKLALSEKRAVGVKDYLVEVWGISPARITVKKQNLPDKHASIYIADGIEENQRAELSSSDFNIMKPVSLSDIRRSANPPVVQLTPIINAEAGLKNWDMNVAQSGTLLRKYNGTDKAEMQKWEVAAEPIPSLETPLTIKLNAVDMLGTTKNIEKDLKIQQKTIKKKKEIYKDNKKIEKFSLILFDYDKADITAKQKPLLDDIKSRIKADSKVTIAGYADRTGENAYNKELALRRCNEVQKILNVTSGNLTITPVGSDDLLFDNDSPQGRSYCRTVRIIIETPVK